MMTVMTLRASSRSESQFGTVAGAFFVVVPFQIASSRNESRGQRAIPGLGGK